MDDFTLQLIETNGIKVRAAIEGTGPLVIMLHGWPELWYSWRHQIKPIASAGYRVVVPDVRGYGGSDRPNEIQAYDMATLIADVLGVIDFFDEEKAILIGHDWGSRICWATTALHPQRIAAVAGLSVPYATRALIAPIALYKQRFAGKFLYQIYFQDEGVAEAELEADIGDSLRKIYYSISGDAPSLDPWLNRPAGGGLLDGLTIPDLYPAWLSDEDLEYLVSQFSITGFRGALNRYRNQDRDYEQLPQIGAVRIKPPACFIAGSKDLVRHFNPGHDSFANLEQNFEDLRINEIIPGKGHWIQQEAPELVNTKLLEFLSTLSNN